VLNQTDEKTFSVAELEKFIQEQVYSSKIPQYCSIEKITVMEDSSSVKDRSLVPPASA